jgi:hypothetical protein
MKRSTLTLKAGPIAGQPSANAPPTVVAGKPKPPSALMLKHLQCHAEQRHRVFIQMRNGAGYCGVPVLLEDGWLTMTDVSIHGTKQTVASNQILIQLKDGSFIAHLHAVEKDRTTGVKNDHYL